MPPESHALQNLSHLVELPNASDEEPMTISDRDSGATEYDYDAVAHALDIGPDSTAAQRTIDITTLGARSGIARRVEVWFHRVDGRWYLTGMPRPRSWYANLRAHQGIVASR